MDIKTLVQHLANLTNCEKQIPYDESLGTSPLNHGKLTKENPKSFVNAGMIVIANNFYI